MQNVRVKNTNRNDLKKVSLVNRFRSGVTDLFGSKEEDIMIQTEIPGVENDDAIVQEINLNKYTLKSSNSSFYLSDV